MKKIILFFSLLFFLVLVGSVSADCCPGATVCDGYCSSGTCWKSKTNWNLGKCLLEEGDPCGAGSAYGIYSCGWGTKCDNPLGSGKCRSPGSQGTSCGKDSDCNSGLFCDWQFRCKNRLSEGSTCSDDGDCKSGLKCLALTCQKPGVEGSSCTTNAECNSGLYCDLFKCKAKKGVGGSCSADWVCKSGLVCLDLSCQEQGNSKERCFGIGQGSCKSGLVCDFYGECRHDPPLTGEICDKTNPVVPICAKGLFCNILRCEERRKAGEQCFASGDCASGLECRICLSKNCDYASQCFPQPSNKIIDEAACLAMYSSSTHKTAKNGGITMNFGAGSAASVGVGATDESGTVYGQDGSYGCYLSYCTGGEISAGISDFATVGLYNSYEAFISGATNTVQSAGIGEFASVSTSQVFDTAGNLVGTQDSFGFGVGLSPPLSGGYYTCNSVVRTVIKPSGDKTSGTASSTPSVTVSSTPSGTALSDPPRIMPSDTDESSGQPVQPDSEQDSNKENSSVSTPTEHIIVEEGIIPKFIDWLMGLFR